MYKRISMLVVIGFSFLLALGLGTSLFLSQKLQQRVDAAIAETLLQNQTRVSMRDAQVAYMLMVQLVGELLLDPAPGDAFEEKRWREQNARENATARIETALVATQNLELKRMLRKLMNHHHQVTLPLGDEVLWLATTDLDSAQQSYWHKYRPAQEEDMALIHEAIRLSSDELSGFSTKSNETAAQAQFVSRITIIMFACLGLGSAVFLGFSVSRLIRLTEKAAAENKNMMDNSLDVICSIDETGRFTQVSSASERNWGYSPDELVGKPYLERVHPKDAEQTRQTVAEIMAGGTTRNFGNRYIHKNGSVVYVKWSAQWSNNQRRIFCVAHDESENKRAIDALQASEERTRLIVATAHDAFAGLDADGNIIDWNKQAEATFGWLKAEACGKPFQELIIASPLRTLYRQTIEQLKFNNDAPITNRRIELSALHRDGHELPIEFSISPIRSDETFMFSAFLRDINERKRSERELYQAKEAAEAATSAKSEFLANMSHEIRTPLNGVIGFAGLMLNTPLSVQQHEFMTLIKSSADSLLRLLNDILDFSKMEARKLELDVIEFDVRELIGNTLKAFSAMANEKGLELAYQVAPDMPELMLGDPGRLAQIIVNLAGNALKFTERGEVVVRVEQESCENGHSVLHFSIADTGIGMSAEQQLYIFNAFAQGDASTTRRYGGTGLGLAIVSQLVKLMNGTIRVESEPGKGTTSHFTARLDLPEQQPLPVQRRLAILNNMPVLVVDNNSTNRLILAEILSSWCMHPVVMDDGAAAVTEMERAAGLGEPYRLVLVDSRMPEFDGFQLVKSIKRAPALASATIMMLSSNDVSDEIERCRELGVTRFLRKPVKQSELFDAIMEVMGVAYGIDSVRTRPANELPMPPEPVRLLKVLVAEDHPVNQKVVTEILRERGHAFSIANNGIEAVQMLEHDSFDVVLMDAQMPQMDGYQATAEIRQREKRTGKHIRIIALTALAMKNDRERCLAAGMDGYVSKPVDPDLLLQCLESEQEHAINPVEDREETAVAVKAFDRADALKRVKGKHAFLKRLAQVFLQEMPVTMADILAAAAAGDALRLERSAHRLKGAASTMSAKPLADAAARLEHAVRTSEPRGKAEVSQALRALEALAAELGVELEMLINGDA